MDVALVELLPIPAVESPEIMEANEYLENIKFRRLSNDCTIWCISVYTVGKTYMLKPCQGLDSSIHGTKSTLIIYSFNRGCLCAGHHVESFSEPCISVTQQFLKVAIVISCSGWRISDVHSLVSSDCWSQKVIQTLCPCTHPLVITPLCFLQLHLQEFKFRGSIWVHHFPSQLSFLY